MRYFKQFITLILLAALNMGSVHAMKEPTKQKQTLLQRLVMQYRANRYLIHQSQIHAINLPPQKLAELRAERRRILKRVALAGLGVAFLAALGIAARVAVKKYGEGKAPVTPSPSFKELHPKLAPPGLSATPGGEAQREGFVAEEETFDPKESKEFEEQWKRDHPEEQKELTELFDIGDAPEVTKALEETE